MRNENAQQPYRYRAFISYSHRDEAVCARLHRFLDGYVIPKGLRDRATDGAAALPGRLYPVFRDRDELAASSSLPERLQQALAESENLIVVCSPDAARSEWVNEEIRQFARQRSAQHIFPVIVRDDPPGCFPAALIEVTAEPLAADLRDEGDGFSDGALKLIAGILGVPYAALKDREAARQRRRARLNLALAGVFAVLASVAGFLAVVANRSLDDAEAAIGTAIDGVKGVQEEIARQEQSGKITTDVALNLLQRNGELIARIQQIAPENDRLELEIARYRILESRQLRRFGRLDAALASARSARDAGSWLAERSAALAWDGGRFVAAAHNELGDTHKAMGELQAAIADYRTGLQLARILLDEHADQPHRMRDVGVALDKLGDVLRQAGRHGEAQAAYQEALELARRFAVQEHGDRNAQRDIALGLSKLADLAWDQGHDERALGLYAQALGITQQLLTGQAGNRLWLRDKSAALINIGDVHLQRLETRVAAQHFAEAVAIRRDLLAKDTEDASANSDLARALEKLADTYYRGGELAAAQPLYDEVVQLKRALVERDPANLEWLSGLSATLDRLGDVLSKRQRIDESQARYAESLAISERLVEQAPQNTAWSRGLYIGHDRVAGIKQATGDLNGALADRTRQLELIRSQLQRNPQNAIWRGDLVNGLSKLGDLYSAMGEPDKARAAFSEALSVSRKLVDESPDDAARLYSLSINLERLASHHAETQNPAQAMPLYEEASALSRRLLDSMPDKLAAQKNLAIDLQNLIDTAVALDDLPKAVEAAHERLELLSGILQQQPAFVADVVAASTRLAELHIRQNRPAAAVDAYRPAVELIHAQTGTEPAWRADLALALARLADWQVQAGDRVAGQRLLDQRLDLVEQLADEKPAIWLREVAATALVLSDFRVDQRQALLSKAIQALDSLQAQAELNDNDRRLREFVEQQIAR